MKPFDVKNGDGIIRILPFNNGTLVVENVDLYKLHCTDLMRKKSKKIQCPSGDQYMPGKCPICDMLYEELYLEEYNDSVLWI